MSDKEEIKRINREKLKRIIEERKKQASIGKVADNSIPIAESKEFYLMSSVQKRMFLLCQIDSDSTLYNISQNYKIMEEVNPDALKEALQKLIERYEILRTSFIEVDGELVQKILPNVDADFEYFSDDFTSEEELIRKFKRPFDLTNPPLIRIQLINRGKYFLLNLDMHHIIGDGMSMDILLRELNELYIGNELTPLTHQYKDYSEWMRKRDMSSQAEYWKSQFDDEIPVLDMPLDFVRPQEQSFKGANVEKGIGKELTAKLKKLAIECGATDFVVFMSATMLLLSKYSRQEDIVVGTPISGRIHKDTESMLGMFVNTLAMRGKPEKEKTFRNFLGEIKDICFSAYENQEYPFEELVEVVNAPRDMSRNPIFDVMLSLQNFGESSLNNETTKFEYAGSNSKDAKFDLTFYIGEYKGEYGINLEYCTDIYKKESAEGLVNHFISLLMAITDNPDKKLGEVEIVSEDEKQTILCKFNDTKAPYPSDKTVVELFEEQVEKTPENIAVVYEDNHITYRELNERANALAHKLRDLGVGPDDFIAIIAVRSIEMIEGIYGIIKSGGAYVPIDPTYPEERIRFMLEDANPKAVLVYTDEEVSIIDKNDRYVSINDKEIPVIDLANGEVFKGEPKNPERVNKPDDAVYCIYTSGTTGKPKGVPNVNRGLINRVLWMHEKYHLSEEDAILQKTTFTFDVSVWEIIWWSLVGARVVMLKQGDEKSPEDIMKTIEKNKITHMHFVPSMLNMFLLDVEGKDVSGLKSLKYVFSSGEALSKDSLRLFNDLIRSKNEGTRLINLYGPTESSIDVTYFDCEYDYESLPIGKPINNVQIYIVQGDKLCGIGMPGELCIGGVGLARGYLNREELTAEKFVKNPFGEGRMYHTGDLARWLPDGNIDYLGRIDEQVKIRGLRIELGEIESRIREIESVKDAAVIAREDGSGDKAIFAYFVAEDGVEISVSDIRENLSVNLPDYMIPAYIMQIESIPVTKNGKLDRRALPEIEAKTEKEYVAPRNEIEEKICNIFSEILGAEKVGIKDGFFELGGHSLRATKLVNRIEEQTGKRIALKNVFSNSTPEKLAVLVGRESEEEYVSIPKAEEKEYYPMSSSQKRTYLITQMDSDGVLYNMPANYKLTGEVRPEAVKEAIQKLIDRHEILRTSFIMVDGEPMQKILPRVEADFEYIEHSEESDEKLVENFTRPFDLGNPPLVRARLVNKGDYHLLSIDMHHIISDGMSLSIFSKEFNALYNGEELAPLTHQYKDYSEWMRTRDLSGQAEYWKNQFDDEIPVLDMPLDFTRPQEQSYEGNKIGIGIGKALTDKVKKVAMENGATDFMVFMSAAMVLLSKYSRQEDIVIGTPISGRTHRDTEGMLGMFVNTLALRGKPEANKTYKEFLAEIKETSLKAYENQEYPFEELVEVVDVERDMSRSPLFDVMLVLQNNEEEEISFGDTKSEWVDSQETVSKFDLSFLIIENNGEYGVLLEYCSALYTDESAKLLANHFVILLENLVSDITCKLGDVEVINEDERFVILEEFNDIKSIDSRDKTVVELFEEQVEKTPETFAVVFEGSKITYRELNERANALAFRLRDLGVHSDDFVAVIADRSLEMIQGIWGVLKSGGAYVPIDSTYPEERIKFMLEDSNPKAVLIYTDEEISIVNKDAKNVNINDREIPIIDLTKSEVFVGGFKNPEIINNPENLMYCIYTSGTTGRPKGVDVEHSGAAVLCKTFAEKYSLDGKKLLQMTNVTFDPFVEEVFSAHISGATIFVANETQRRSAQELYNLIKENDISIADVPLVMLRELESYLENDSVLESVICGGEQLPEYLKNKVLSYGINLYNHYGPTEAIVDATVCDCLLDEKVNIGKPYFGSNAYILQGDSLCGIGIPGELCIGGDLARGYHNMEKLTNEKFVKNPFGEGRMYHSGDLARWLPDGNIEYLGRIDEQVKIRGFRVELGEVENRIREIEGIIDVAVIARTDDNGDKSIYAYYVVEEGKILVSDIRENLSVNLPDYMIPAYMMQIEKIPVNKNGKLDKRALPEIKVKTEKDYVAPRNDIEKDLANIYKEVLGVDRVGIYDDFFMLGGNSIKAMRMIAKIRSRNLNISLKEMYSKKTIFELAKAVQKNDSNSEFLEDNKVLSLDTINVQDGMVDKKLLIELAEYRRNIIDNKVINSYKPNYMQKGFILDSYSENRSIIEDYIVSGITKQKLLNSLMQIVKSQSVFRTGYSEDEGKLVEYSFGTWSIPVLKNEEFTRENIIKTLKSVKTENGDYILPVIIVLQKETDFEVFVSANHSLWDNMSSNIMVDLLNKSLYSSFISTLEDTNNQSFGEYIIRRNNASKDLYSKEEKERLLYCTKKYMEALPGKAIDNKVFRLSILRDDNTNYDFQWFLDRYINVLEISDLEEVPISVLYHGRNSEKSLNNLGMYLELIPCIYNRMNKQIHFLDEKIKKIKEDGREYGYIFNESNSTKFNDFIGINLKEHVEVDEIHNLNKVEYLGNDGVNSIIEVTMGRKMITMDMVFKSYEKSEIKLLERIKKEFVLV